MMTSEHPTGMSKSPIGRDGENKPESNIISKKVAKILDNKIETDREIIDALNTVSTFFNQNTLHNRRNLRRDIEHFSLQVNLKFLESFKKVKEELDRVSISVAAMNACCADMSKRLQTTKSQTHDLINQTTKLRAATRKVERRREIADVFISIFQLRPEEVAALDVASEGVIKKEFFDALQRTKEIHADCKQLLLSGQHTAALEIMSMMAARQETSYEMLYRWIQKQSDTLNADRTDINDMFCQAFGALEARPVLFRYSLDECCNSRRNNVVRSFLNALTKGSSNGVPKPMELLSHDSLHYVNDMLAWIHQALASEKEFIQVLLKDCSEEALSQITEGLCRPFKVRVEQILGGENGPVILYKLSNLFRFYYNTISPSLEKDAPLLEVINDLSGLLINLFKTSLTASLNKILDKMEPPSQELIPVKSVHQVLLLLRDVLAVHDVVLAPTSDKKESFAGIFSTVIDTLLNALLVACTDLNAIDLAVYMLNCLYMISSLLSVYEYTEERLEMLHAQMEVHTGVLISEQAGYIILQRTGISEIYNAFLQLRPNQVAQRLCYGPSSKIPGLDALSLLQSFEKFSLFLISPDSYKLIQCQLISSPKIKQAVDQGTMKALVEACHFIHEKLSDPANQYSESLNELLKQLQSTGDILLK